MPNQLDGALSRPNSLAGAVISKMEDILIANIDALAQARPMSISIRSRTTGNIQLVQFPSSKRSDARKFSRCIKIKSTKLNAPVGLLTDLSRHSQRLSCKFFICRVRHSLLVG